jgi:DNA (cytosine-5)-methyltransferase 1
MNIISLYSGADNLGDGIIQAGHKIKLCIELNKDCCDTIKLNHPGIEVINGKVSDYLTTLPKCDAVVGGAPCQVHSIANSNRTHDLCEVHNFFKAVDVSKAKYHFMENVPQLYKVFKKSNFLVNCADYGVPQTRKRRIFTNLPLPKPTHSKTPSVGLFDTSLKKWKSVKDALGLDGIIQDRKITYGSDKWREYSTDRPSITIHTDSRMWFVSPTGFKDKKKKQISRSVDEPIMTIVAGNDYQFTDKPVMSTSYHQYKNDYKVIRKLNNNELAILQDFRSDFKFAGGKTSIKRQIGNALPSTISRLFFTGVVA